MQVVTPDGSIFTIPTQEQLSLLANAMRNSGGYAVPDTIVSTSLKGLYGSRQKAQAFADSLKEPLLNNVVVVDVSELKSASQGFVDELCKQFLSVHGAKELIFVNASDRFKYCVDLTSGIRLFEEKVSFEYDEDETNGR